MNGKRWKQNWSTYVHIMMLYGDGDAGGGIMMMMLYDGDVSGGIMMNMQYDDNVAVC